MLEALCAKAQFTKTASRKQLGGGGGVEMVLFCLSRDPWRSIVRTALSTPGFEPRLQRTTSLAR